MEDKMKLITKIIATANKTSNEGFRLDSDDLLDQSDTQNDQATILVAKMFTENTPGYEAANKALGKIVDSLNETADKAEKVANVIKLTSDLVGAVGAIVAAAA